MILSAITAAATNSAASMAKTAAEGVGVVAESRAEGVGEPGTEQAAEAGGKRLRGAPETHARAFAARAAVAGELHHRGDRGDGEDAVGEAEQAHRRAQRQGHGPPCPSTATSPSAAAESRQPAETQKRSVPSRSALAARPTVAMPSKHAGVLRAGQRGRLARREAEDQAGIGFEDQLLHEVGGHRQEDEDA